MNITQEEKIEYMFKVFFDLRNNNSELKRLKAYLSNKENRDKGFIITGVGKNFYIAEKVYKTFISMGLKCQALDCVHALHGDLGMVDGQTIIFVSKSGTTEELVHVVKVLKALRDRGIKNFTSVGFFLNNSLSEDIKNLYDYFIVPSKKFVKENMYEFDKRNLVPSLSINIMQLILDELGVEIFEQDENLVKNYKYNHMGGSNGKRLGVDSLLKEFEQ